MSKQFERNSTTGKLATFSSIGGYPIYYISNHNNCLCSNCANEFLDERNDGLQVVDFPISCDINYEDEDLYCDSCSERIESAYGDDEEENRDLIDEQEWSDGRLDY